MERIPTHTLTNLFLLPAIGVIAGVTIAGQVGLFFGGAAGLTVGILLNRSGMETDRRIAELEQRVDELEEERDG